MCIIIHASFETVQLEISAFLCLLRFLFVLTLLIYCNLINLRPSHLQPLRDLKCKEGWVFTCVPTIRVNWEVFVRGTHGFGDAYPKRAPKLLVGRSQTLLSYAVGGSIHTDNCYVSIFIFCSFNCLCGCLSTDLSLANFSKKRKHYFGQFFPYFYHFSTLSPNHPCYWGEIFSTMWKTPFPSPLFPYPAFDNSSFHFLKTERFPAPSLLSIYYYYFIPTSPFPLANPAKTFSNPAAHHQENGTPLLTSLGER